jgi:transposase
MGKTYTHQERARVLEAAAEGRNWRLVAIHNEVELETARHWVQRARKTWDFTPPPDRRGGGYNRKLEEHHLNYLEGCLSENYHIILREMQDLLLEEFGIRVECRLCAQTLMVAASRSRKQTETTITATSPKTSSSDNSLPSSSSSMSLPRRRYCTWMKPTSISG